jgi:hypothetical protein
MQKRARSHLANAADGRYPPQQFSARVRPDNSRKRLQPRALPHIERA